MTKEYRLDACKKEFLKKYADKKKSYIEVSNDYSNANDKPKSKKKEEGKKEEIKQKISSLHIKVQDLLNLIYNRNFISQQIIEIGYDENKLPLGKLGKPTILKGFSILKKIEQVLKGTLDEDLNDLSSQYYSYIPHCFGFQKMRNFKIDSLEKLKQRTSHLESLSDIEIATKILDETEGVDDLVDQYYKRLNCKIEPLSPGEEIYGIINKYFANTINKQFDRVSITEIFEIKRNGEYEKYNKGLHNKMLLWHGSRVTNFVGILSQGLRIAPPEAPVSGYLYGKGLYFADMAGKSLNYCYPSDRQGLILLCEVAVGDPNPKANPDYNSGDLPCGKHSTKAIGDIYPPEDSYYKYEDLIIPLGEAKNHNGYKYNEYVVYNENQVKIRYLMRLKWN